MSTQPESFDLPAFLQSLQDEEAHLRARAAVGRVRLQELASNPTGIEALSTRSLLEKDERYAGGLRIAIQELSQLASTQSLLLPCAFLRTARETLREDEFVRLLLATLLRLREQGVVDPCR